MGTTDPTDFDTSSYRTEKRVAGSRHTAFIDEKGTTVLLARSSLAGGGIAINVDALCWLADQDGPIYVRGINSATGRDFCVPLGDLPGKTPRMGKDGSFVIFEPEDFEKEAYPPFTGAAQNEGGEAPF